MKKVIYLLLVSASAFLFAGCQNDQDFNDAKEKGIAALNKEEPEKAEVYFETALEEKEDKQVTTLLKYSKTYQDILEKYEKQEFDGLQEQVTSFLKQDLEKVEQSKEILTIQKELTDLTAKKDQLSQTYTEAKKLYDGKKYDETQTTLDEVLKDPDLSKSYFKAEFDKFTALKTENDKKIKEQQAADAKKKKKAAEAAAKAAEEKLAEEKKAAEVAETENSVVPTDIQGTWYAASADAPAFTIDSSYFTDEATGKKYKITSADMDSSGSYVITWDIQDFEERYGQGSAGPGPQPFVFLLNVNLSGSEPTAFLMDQSGNKYITK